MPETANDVSEKQSKTNSHFFAYLSRMRWIQRWGLKRNAISENIMEHSFEVATIAHALAVIRNRLFDGTIDPGEVTIAALYHDASEVLTGDLPSPIKYHNQKIRDAYKAVEYTAEKEMLSRLPAELQADYARHLLSSEQDPEIKHLIKAADMIACYTKCKAEINAGNPEFTKAIKDIEERLDQFDLPELDYFRATYLNSFDLTLDELITPNEPLIPSPPNSRAG
jgi:5'-deoxynucleotidase